MKTKSKKYKFILTGALVILLAAISQTVYSQSASPKIDLQVEPAFEGNYKYGEWLPIWLTLENNGQDLEAEAFVIVEQGGGRATYSVPVSLPAGSRKQVPLYVLPNNFSREVVVHVTSEDQEIAKSTIPVLPNQNDFYLIGIAAPEVGPISQITSITFEQNSRKIVSFNLSLAHLPEKAIALNSLDAIILNDTDTSQLNPEQKQALINWVRNGGRLIIGGGPGLEKTLSGLPAELAQIQPERLLELEDLSALEIFSNNEPILLNGPFLINQVSHESGASLALQGDVSLVQEWNFGKGHIDFIALDLTQSPFNAWSGTPVFWQNLLSPGSSYHMWLPRDTSIRQMRASNMYYPLTNQPSMDLPSVRGLGILLGVYILLVGPVNYLILRSKKKFHLAWITIPVLTALFTAGAFGVAHLLRGNDILINNISIINLQPDGSADVTSYIGVFSPAEETYTLEVSGSPLLSLSNAGYYDPWSSVAPAGISNTRFSQGNPSKISGLNINQWSLNSFNVESLSTQFGTIETDLVLENGKLTGSIESNLPYTIKNAAIIVGMQMKKIGDLVPNQKVEINFEFEKEITKMGTPTTYQIVEQLAMDGSTELYSRNFELRRSILDSVLQPFGYWLGPNFGITTKQSPDEFVLSSTYLVGWMEHSPTEITLDGSAAAQQALSLISYYPYLKINSESFSLPPSTIPGQLTEFPINGGYCGGADSYIYLDRGDATLEFTLPDVFANTSADSLILEVRDESAWNLEETTLGLSLYHWAEGAWIQFDGIVNGSNTVNDPEGLISENGLIHVKVSRPENNFGGGCIYVAVGLNGSLDQ